MIEEMLDSLCAYQGENVMAHQDQYALHGAPGESREGTPLIYATRNDLAADARRRMVPLLNQQLADCLDLQGQCKQAHWNVKGPAFIALHELFDKVSEAIEGYADLIAERLVQLGGVA